MFESVIYIAVAVGFFNRVTDFEETKDAGWAFITACGWPFLVGYLIADLAYGQSPPPTTTPEKEL